MSEYVMETAGPVRRVKRGLDIYVQRLVQNEWIDVWSTNTMSDDYAYSASANHMMQLLKRIEKGAE